MSDERLKMLKWQHLKVELDNREKDWPDGSKYEFDHDRQTVIWSFGKQLDATTRLVWHLTDKDLSIPKPSAIASQIIEQALKIAKGQN